MKDKKQSSPGAAGARSSTALASPVRQADSKAQKQRDLNNPWAKRQPATICGFGARLRCFALLSSKLFLKLMGLGGAWVGTWSDYWSDFPDTVIHYIYLYLPASLPACLPTCLPTHLSTYQ